MGIDPDLNLKLLYIHGLLLRMITFMTERGLWTVPEQEALERYQRAAFEMGKGEEAEVAHAEPIIPPTFIPTEDIRSSSVVLMD